MFYGDQPKTWYGKLFLNILLSIYAGGNYLLGKWESRKELDNVPKEK